MAKPLHVLILEDRPDDAELMTAELRRRGFDPDWERVETEEAYLASLRSDLDVILADYTLPQFDALEALRLLRERGLDVPFVVVTGTIGQEAAVACLKEGADDYVLKDRLTRLGPAVEQALEAKRLREERRAAERDARVSARQWQATFDAISDPLFLLDAGGRIVRCNQATVDFYGRPRKKIVGRSCSEVVHGLSEHIEDCPYVRAMESMERESLVWSVGDRWFRAVVDPLLDESGYVVGFVHLLEDITARKRSEEAVRRRKEELSLLNEAGEAFSASLDLDAVLGTVLEEAREVLDAVGCSVWLREDGTGDLICRQAAGVEGDVVRGWRLPPGEGFVGWAVAHEESLIIADAEADERHFKAVDEATGLPIRSLIVAPLKAEGKVLGALEAVDTDVDRFDREDRRLLEALAGPAANAIQNARLYERARDEVRRRQRVEERLRKEKERYQDLFEGTPIGLYRTTPEGEIVAGNAAMARMLGYEDRESLLKANAHDFYVREEDRARELERLQEAGAWGRVELQLRKTDGEVVWVLDTGRAVRDDEGRVRYYDGALEDITERKRAQEKLRRRARQLAALQETVLDITAQHDLDELLDTIVERAVGLLDARSGGMYLCEPEQEEVRCVVSYNTPEDYCGTILTYGEGAAGTVAQSGEPLIIDDYRTWSGRAEPFEEGEPFTAVLTVPMIWQDEVIGTLNVLGDVESRRFTEEDQELLALFADHAAIAVEDARLHRRARREIVERERVAAALRESEERYRLLVDRSLAGFYRTAPDGEILACNDAFARIYGYGSREEILEASAFDLYFDEANREAFLQEIREQGAINAEEFRMRTRDGDPVWVLENATLVEEDGRTIIEGTQIDFTEWKRAQEALRESERSLAKAQRVANVGHFQWDLKNDHVTWSNQMYRIFGLDPASYSPTVEGFAQLVHPEDRHLVHASNRERLVRRKHHELEYRIIDQTMQEVKHVHVAGETTFDSDGTPVHVMGVFHDITERKRAEQALRKKVEELQRTNELFVGREQRVLALKREVNALLEALGRPPRYDSPAQADALREDEGT